MKSKLLTTAYVLAALCSCAIAAAAQPAPGVVPQPSPIQPGPATGGNAPGSRGTSSPRIITLPVATDPVLTTDSIIAWDKTTGSASSEVFPACAPGNTKTYTIIDEKGDAATNNITLSAPAGTTFNGAATLVVNTANGFARLVCDPAHANYMKY